MMPGEKGGHDSAWRLSMEGCMASVTIEEAQAKLPQLIESLTPGEEVVITRDGQPWAQVKKTERTSWPCQAGSYRKAEFWMAPDFDAPLDDFKEYVE
jgi:antitoxin (DNA-binding transcriptional repressor) of toxin-antitoxin stability system